jgi:hypothetical protein
MPVPGKFARMQPRKAETSLAVGASPRIVALKST